MNKAAEKFDWIEVIRFPLMIGVVLIHTSDPIKGLGGTMVSLQGRNNLADEVMYLLSQILARLSVPAFFVFAGFFFIKATHKNGIINWGVQLKKKIGTLVIPFIFWNAVVMCLFYFGQKSGFVPVGPGSRKGDIENLSIWGLFDLLVGATRHPAAYQFWFMRDLILCIVFSLPLIFLSQAVYLMVLMSVGVIWFFELGIFDIPSLAAIFFFCLGGAFGINNSLLKFNNSDLKIKILIIFFILMCLNLFLRDYLYVKYIHRIYLILGIFSIYPIAEFILQFRRISKWLKLQSAVTFFLFALHEPFLMLVKKIVFGISSWNGLVGVLFAYVFPVFVVVVIVGWIYKIILQIAPKFLAFSTGGRS